MAWTKTSGGGQKQYKIYTETLTTKSVGNGTYNWSSQIDFVPPGHDFIVIANTAATNLSTSTHVELFVAYTKNAALASRYRHKVSPFLAVTSEIDTATKILTRDVSERGQFPYYFLKVPKGGGSVTLAVIVGDKISTTIS